MTARPISVLIAALGGDGGGVLTSWIEAAAIGSGHVVQSTCIPGVAQRTGTTTYYLEIVPGAAEMAGKRRVLALNAAPGEVDVLLASELLECVRALAAGFVTPERTFLIAADARVFTVEEKIAMGDGRFDAGQMRELAAAFSARALLADFRAIAARSNSPLSAVLLGALARSRVLPIAEEAFRAAIRAAGVAVKDNLRGFDAGLAAAAPSGPAAAAPSGSPAGARAFAT